MSRDWDVSQFSFVDADGQPVDANSPLAAISARFVVAKENLPGAGIRDSSATASNMNTARLTRTLSKNSSDVTAATVAAIINSYEQKVLENLELRNEVSDVTYFVTNYMKVQQLETEQFQRELTQRHRRQAALASLQKLAAMQPAQPVPLDPSQPITIQLDTAPRETGPDLPDVRLHRLFLFVTFSWLGPE